METAAYLYPWDIVDDPAAADVVAGLGLDHVVLAAVYHGTRALTPRHPRHRIVVADRTAAYYPADGAHWQARSLRPARAEWMPSEDSFGVAADALRAAGVPVHAWAVVNHVDLPLSSDTVVNAFGDRYPWALCPARDAVVDYATGIAADLASLPGVDGVELESCGWYGFDHLSAHDKTPGAAGSATIEYLLSLCFCEACDATLSTAGIDVRELRTLVRQTVDRLLAGGEAARGAPVAGEWQRIAAALGEPLAERVLATRQAIADRFRATVVDQIRASRSDLTVNLHAHPEPHRSLSFTGVDPATAAKTVDGLVVSCWTGLDAVTPSLAGDARVHASLLAVAEMGGRRRSLASQAIEARAAGAQGIRLYHAGLASAADLAAIRHMTSHLHQEA